MSNETIGVVGLGYVGLPVAVAAARHFPHTVGFDIDEKRVAGLKDASDRTGEVSSDELASTTLEFTTDPTALAACTFLIVTVPTPIDANRQPDLRPLLSASKTVGSVLKKGTVVVYESTVYPGLTEEVCGPALEAASGLRCGVDFFLGYSPERINPGDRVHRLETITKVVAGATTEVLDRVAAVYERIVTAGVHRAPSIQVAEAAKVIENTQRDLNIALMNELALIFDRLGIRTLDVLEAAGTKWNFLPFRPGLVGGHCIGVDPYYLTAKAEASGYYPQVILSGRRINDGMGAFVAQKLVKLLIAKELPVKGARVGVFGLTFKENVPDLRNSRVPDILVELREFGIEAIVVDPMADAAEAQHEYGVELVDESTLQGLDAVILAVAHQPYLDDLAGVMERIKSGGVLVDVKSAVDPAAVRPDLTYWSL